MVERTETLPVRGEPTEVLAQVAVCPFCNSDMSDERLDDATLVAAFSKYREKHHLMAPEEMRRLRERYGLGVRAFSLLLGWGEITLHRYEAGSLQDAAHEAALRMAEDPANLRIYLSANGHKLTARQRARLEAHLDAIEVSAAAESDGSSADRFVVREEQDAYGGWVPMRLTKLREMILFFAQLPEMYETKLNKLLFYADFGHFKTHGASISGSPYLAFQFGPVPQHYPWIEADLVEGADLSVNEVFFAGGGSGTVLKAERQPDLAVFSAEELATLRDVAESLGGKTSRQLKDLSHNERAWREAEAGEMIDYAFAKDLSYG
jgi:putative zinc finger/helix-turn-helix YgiT family protein